MSEAEEQAWQKHKTVWPLEAGVEPMNHEFAFRMGYRAGQAVSLPDRETLARTLHKSHCGCNDFGDESEDSSYWRMADAVLAALSTQPAAGEVETGGDQTWCALDEENRLIVKPHDPCPIKVRTKAGAWVTTLPMSALGYHMGHEVQEFAPDVEFCQRPDHYFTALSGVQS